MATTWLLRLYPEAWRDRYGVEFSELLLARPPSARDRLDILLGAVDARLHPQLTNAAVIRTPTGADRVIALAGVLAGALFSGWASIIMLATPPWGSMELVNEGLMASAYAAGLIGLLLGVGVLVALAARYMDELGTWGTTAAIVSALGFFAAMSGATIVAVVLLAGGSVALAPRLSRIVHPLVAGGFALATILLALAMFGFAGSGGQGMFWLLWLGAYGPAWMALGFSLRRGRRADRIETGTGVGDPAASAAPAGA